QGDREHRHDGEPRVLGEHPEAVLEVLNELSHAVLLPFAPVPGRASGVPGGEEVEPADSTVFLRIWQGGLVRSRDGGVPEAARPLPPLPPSPGPPPLAPGRGG